ncbi:Lrp/AsnC family transcriptional regulator [Nocardia sp. alder85J]|uniref:Lrp/AsnC family transcriptional regulator n=1 Tax=Nocardia sp. alder85J TaxID=2862949 RepID=UPI001CD2C5B8|nr:Lrp/AsnC family transcriptional regulator [Nocardia sp. alder85J]MCX4096452.1 Lrp/AsnC family transcriptional regulator [Nocardia sp. alder85J]
MLDETDRGLIHALHLDGRAPFNRIGEVLGVSTQTVARRYRRLRAGAGLRVVGLPDPGRTGGAQWLLRLTCTPAAGQRLAQALSRRPETSWVMLTSGGTEVFLIVDAPGPDTPALLLHDLPRTSAITGISAHYVLHTYLGGATAWPGRLRQLGPEQQRELLAPDDSGAETGGATGRTAPGTRSGGTAGPVSSADPTPAAAGRVAGPADAALFAALRADGRTTLADLAAATGWSATTVARRMGELRAGGALYFDVELDDRSLGITTRALLWAAVVPGRLDEVGHTLSQHPELAFVAATTGRTNLVAEALCPDPAALHTYLTQRLGALDAVHTLETTPVLATVKATSQPDVTSPRR